jgi:CspA family cold shock protein
MPEGTIKKWIQDKGLGFITPSTGGPEVFFHESALREGEEIAEGLKVTYAVGSDKKTGKTKAVTVDLA